jgi:hypothetical protein
MMMVVDVVVVMMMVPPHVMMMVVMTDLHRDLGDFGALSLGQPSIVRRQQRYGIRYRIEQIPIARHLCGLRSLPRGRLGAGHGRECCGRSQQAGYSLIHNSSIGRRCPLFAQDDNSAA